MKYFGYVIGVFAALEIFTAMYVFLEGDVLTSAMYSFVFLFVWTDWVGTNSL